MSRRTTDAERDLFHATIAGRAAVKSRAAAHAPPMAKKPKKASTSGGVDGNTGDRLRRGAIAPDAKLDLHGMTEAAAHHTLLAFLRAAHRRGDRLVLVVTGKGAEEDGAAFDLGYGGRSRGVLKRMVPRWLEEPALSRLIADKRPAHRRHGGEGALYLYLRKAKG